MKRRKLLISSYSGVLFTFSGCMKLRRNENVDIYLANVTSDYITFQIKFQTLSDQLVLCENYELEPNTRRRIENVVPHGKYSVSVNINGNLVSENYPFIETDCEEQKLTAEIWEEDGEYRTELDQNRC
ncbi:hypothetical protein [Natronobacterium lacisalsi]|uniref:hypothetical protein n=1 Tax=Natronobacterium lacisalsi TaxID=229731 RepID=UPI00139059DE|nr:hypothetical protein [Halobiforma lacisalsi]